MSAHRTPQPGLGLLWGLLALYAATVPQAAHADGTAPVDAPSSPSRVVAGEHLSDWLLRNAPAGTDTTALHWQVPAERAAQERLRQAVVGGLGEQPALADWLLALPLTGRLTVARADARWLQADPTQDPVLQDGHRVLLLPRPLHVTVLTESGQPCSVVHTSGALVRDYLQGCLGAQGAAQVDWAWTAQPDGRAQRLGTAPWSATAQDEPGPGAWIWAPSRNARLAPSVSDNLARFLATQLPADGGAAAPQVPPKLPPTPTPKGVRPRDAQFTASDWGEIGLLQTPTARMAPVGDVRMHWSRVQPYTRGTVMFQPMDWLEAGFRYTDVSNRLYGDIAGDQTYKDKSIDLKLRLHQETATWPEWALGVRDLGGTGIFSGEYLVASKRWGNWDASLGLGWGYMGARGTIKAPLAVLGDGFSTRTGNTNASGGTANFSSMFHGPAAPFGGVQWHAPASPWVLKLELDGNDYQHEPFSNNQTASSPFNVGAVYRFSPYVDLSLGLERGSRMMLSFTVHGALDQMQAPKLLDPVLPRASALAPAQLPPAGWAGTAQALELHTGWAVQSITQHNATATVLAQADGAAHLQDRIDRATTLLHRDAPASVQRFVLQLQQRGLPVAEVEIDRTEWVGQHTQPQAPTLRLATQRVVPPTGTSPEPLPGFKQARTHGFSAAWSPSYAQILGGPDDFLLYQIGLQANLEQRFSDTTWISANFNARLLDNYQKFVYDAPSDLPRVRTQQRQYVTTSRTTMPLLQLTHVADMGGGHYASAYAGMLESMYGGAGAEWLYRPWHSPLAFGVDINHVQQRDFQQNLAFRDYSANTGHATVYWDTGWNDVQVKLAAGQYLAGDVGATLDVKRVFNNGVALGAWATRTNVSAEQFGEGSYDKGIYIKIPFDVLLPKSSPGNATVVWNPLSRDGGARLSRSFTLYDLTSQRDARAWAWTPSRPAGRSTAEDRAYVLAEPVGLALPNWGESARTLGHQAADVPASTWMWAGGAILASGLLDTTVDRWVTDGQGSTRLGNATNAMPYALALGAGALWTGLAGQPAADTAGTALTAAAYTLGANLVTRWAVGRSRPQDEQGAADFNGFGASAVRSGFASNHVALAFALATPFAQQHHMPWLYAAAASTSLGRIQNREHWLSDTVAGGLMGYAIGSLVSEQQMGRKKGMRFSATPQSVAATWLF